MASMRDIQRRRNSIASTQQITKAMKLVSTVKLQKAKNRAEQTNPYFQYMYRTVTSMLAKSGTINHPYLKKGESDKKAVVVITSNRGLAGGYNTNVIKQVTSSGIAKEDMLVYSIGRKGKDYLARRGYDIKADYSDVINEPMYRDAMDIASDVLGAYTSGEVSEIYLAYTCFMNTVSQVPVFIKLLPISADDIQLKDGDKEELMDGSVMEYEPEEQEALDIIIPKYVSSLIYGALVESVASENGARMTAMDNATSNADEMIEDLSLMYNRARQGSITQELTEIIAGANAIS